MESFLRIKTVTDKTGLSKNTIYNRIRDGQFPTPVAIGPKAVAWLESEVSAWIQKQIDHSRSHKNAA